MSPTTSYSRTLVKSGFLTALFLGLCLTFNRQLSVAELVLDSPFFIVLFFLLFTVGHPTVVAKWQPQLTSSGQSALIFPTLLIGILYSYLIVHGHSPFQGSSGLFIFFWYSQHSALFPYNALMRPLLGQISFLYC